MAFQGKSVTIISLKYDRSPFIWIEHA